MTEENLESEASAPMESTEPIEATAPEEKFDVIYSCLRCGTTVPNSELSRLPEIKCICGFRVFTKVRTPIVKSIKAI
ncbi:MAG: RNA polymerase Rbp10 [Marine Group I thaumarchaeote]|nr:MAG: RNA polymerase Rbp10 [Marine Group I thaumarchaeote]